jgi:hypothetical protein
LSPEEKELLNITSDATMHQVFKPATKIWVTQKATIPFHLPSLGKDATPVVLLRDPGTPRSDSMAKAEREATSSLRPGVLNRSKPVLPPPSYFPSQSSRTAEPSKPVRETQYSVDSHDPATKVVLEGASIQQPVNKPQKRRIEAVSENDEEDPQPSMKHQRKAQAFPLDKPVDPRTLEFEPASNKAAFPTKYFQFMEKGLNRVSDPTASDLYGNVSAKFEQHFGFQMKRTSYHKHLNTLRYAPDELKDHFRELEVAENSTWKAFRKVVVSIYKGDQDISARLNGVGSEKGKKGQTQRKAEPTEAAIAAAREWVDTRTAKPDLGLVSVEGGYEETSAKAATASDDTNGSSAWVDTTLGDTEDSSDFVLNLMASTTLKTCTTCDKALPEDPSDVLTTLNSAVQANPSSAHLAVEFCQRHFAEALREMLPKHMCWPKSIDFSKLGGRLESIKDDIEEVWNSPVSSPFYEEHLESVKKTGTHRKAASIWGDKNFIGTA